MTFLLNVSWVWQIASTTGDIETMRYILEAPKTKAIRLIKGQSRGLLSQGYGLRCFLLPELVLLHVDLKLV